MSGEARLDLTRVATRLLSLFHGAAVLVIIGAMYLLASAVLVMFCNFLMSRQERRLKKQRAKAKAKEQQGDGSQPLPPAAAAQPKPADPQQPPAAAATRQPTPKAGQPESDEPKKRRSIAERAWRKITPNNSEYWIMNYAHNQSQEPRCSNWTCKSEPMSVSMEPSGWICPKCGKFMPFDVWYPDYQRKEDKTDKEFDEKYMTPVRGIIRLVIALFIIREIIWVFS